MPLSLRRSYQRRSNGNLDSAHCGEVVTSTSRLGKATSLAAGSCQESHLEFEVADSHEPKHHLIFQKKIANAEALFEPDENTVKMASRRALQIGGATVAVGTVYYLYSAGGNPKVAEKKLERKSLNEAVQVPV